MYTRSLGAAAPAPATSSLPFDFNAAMSPIWAGFIMGLTGYTIARAMKIPANQAAGLGVALGATLAIGEIGSSWLKGYLAKAQAPATSPALAAQAQAAPATQAAPSITVTPVGRW